MQPTFGRELDVERELPESDVLYTVEEVARYLRVSVRWLAQQCRAERVEHVHLARARRFTRRQVELLVLSHTVIPDDHKKLDATRQRVLRLLARAPRRG